MSTDGTPPAPDASAQPTSPQVRQRVLVEDDRIGMHPVTLERAMLDHLHYTCSKDEQSATQLDLYRAVAMTARDRLVHRWMATQRTYYEQDVKRVYYLSAEFLFGRMLARNLAYLGQLDVARDLLRSHGVDLDVLLEQETDPGLGNGGLGRLAACFLDSMATLELPGYGYGIRYEFGIFHQRIENGRQVEQGDAWLRHGCPWEIARHEYTVEVPFYGFVEHTTDENGEHVARWHNTHAVLGVPYDYPCPGFGSNTVNTLRLWSARATREFDLQVFNDGDYRRAVEDDTVEGKELRLKQQFFFVCCAIHDILRRYKKHRDTFDEFPDKAAIQLNDTHPAIAVAELMRVLVDIERLPWAKAWEITRKTLAYTNHTLLAEALETWPVPLFRRLLPRHLEIIYEINHRFLASVRTRWPDAPTEQIRRMSLIDERGQKQIRMAHLATVGSHAVNGVARLHSELVRTRLMPDFARLWPEKFQSKTNGVTPRRWLYLCNPALARAITKALGDDGWIRNLDQLSGLADKRDETPFLEQLAWIKSKNKQRLAEIIAERTNITVDPEALFDVQVKRLHEYKRQLMNCLHIVARYLEIKRDPTQEVVPRVFIFGGKAAPGYVMAKLQIKLIHDVAKVVNADPDVRDRIKVVFLPDYNVSLAERIIPAADLSEQISMASTTSLRRSLSRMYSLGT